MSPALSRADDPDESPLVDLGAESACRSWMPACQRVDHRSLSGALTVAALVVGGLSLAVYAACVGTGVQGGHGFGIVPLVVTIVAAASACGAAALGSTQLRSGWGLLAVGLLAHGWAPSPMR